MLSPSRGGISKLFPPICTLPIADSHSWLRRWSINADGGMQNNYTKVSAVPTLTLRQLVELRQRVGDLIPRSFRPDKNMMTRHPAGRINHHSQADMHVFPIANRGKHPGVTFEAPGAVAFVGLTL